jgi:hypothetical protein
MMVRHHHQTRLPFLPATKQEVTMAQPVAGALITIFGIESSSLGCSCEHHNICGRNVDIDTLIRFKRTTVAAGKSRNGRLVFLDVTHNRLSFSR